MGERVAHKYEDIISEVIYDFLDRDPRNVAIFETFWEINDPIVTKRDHKFFLIGSAVYDFLLGRSTKERIIQYLREARHYPTVIVLSTNFYRQDFMNDVNLSGNIGEIIENIDTLIVGAFDDEGFLFWIKQENENCLLT